MTETYDLERGEQAVPTRSEEAYVAIRDKIVGLDMAPGDTFTEVDLAVLLRISKTPIREALGRLRMEGLVTSTPRSGYAVAPVTIKRTRELFDVRVMLESEAAYLSTLRLQSVDHLLELEKLCRSSYSADDASSVTQFLRNNTKFHAGVARMSGNSVLEETILRMLFELERLLHLSLMLKAQADEIIHEHKDLIRAIASGDPERARMVAEQQLRNSQEMVMDALMASRELLAVNVGSQPQISADGAGD